MSTTEFEWDSQPVAWHYVLRDAIGSVNEAVSIDRYDLSITSPFGRAGIDYSAGMFVTEAPLYAEQPAPASASEAPVAVPLTDEVMRDALRQCPHDAVENLRVRWLYATDFARAIERTCAARWGVKLEGGQG